jgi:aspartyl-tRNA(Asn)/glutamyl-tRNA(Gln) amidotransferase subunit A
MIDMYRKTRANGFGVEVQRRIILGTYSLSAGYYDAYYNKASRVRTLIMEDFNKAFEHCDLIVSPVTPSPAFKIGENISDPLTMYLSDIYTLSANLAGIPGMSIPCGFSAEGLPIGMQLLGNRFDEKTLLKTALSFQSATDYHLKKPAIDHRKTM